MELSLILAVVFVALVFEYINGFHDTANAIATSVATRALSPRPAVLMAASFNFIGAFAGMAVAAAAVFEYAFHGSIVDRYLIMAAGLLIGGGAGALIAKMTAPRA